MEQKLKHLEFLQGVINRLSTNSFLLKGWSVVLIAALFTISTHQENTDFAALAYFPALIFWGLDGYFLWKERQYRALYNEVRKKDPDQIDFTMKLGKLSFRKATLDWVTATLSMTLIPFHGVLIAAIIIVMQMMSE